MTDGHRARQPRRPLRAALVTMPAAPPGPLATLDGTHLVTERPPVRRRPSGEPPPLPRKLNTSGKSWLVLTLAVVVSLVVIAFSSTVASVLYAFDHAFLERLASVRSPALTRVMTWMGKLANGDVLRVLVIVNVVILVIWRRWRQLFVWLGAGLFSAVLVFWLTLVVQRPRPLGIEILGPWEGFAMPSLPMAVLGTFLLCAAYATLPAGRPRDIGKSVVVLMLAVTVTSRLYLAQEGPSDALFGVVIGVAVPIAAFRWFAPNSVFPVTYRRGRTAHLDVSGPRGDAIVRALRDQLGIIATDVRPFGLAGSGGSTPLRISVTGQPDPYLFCKLYAITHLRADRWYKLGRTLLYGQLEDEKPFNSVRRLVQYEDYVLRLLYDAQLPVPKPYGIVDITPEREYLLVTQFFDGASEIGEAEVEVDDSIIDQGLLVVRRMWDSGLAHRDIKPANVLVREGRLILIDSAFAQVRPSPWRQAVDLANMMLVLGLRSDARRVYEAARRHFTEAEIAEAFAATRGITMPSQLRGMLRSESRDLHAEFLTLLPAQLPKVRIQRWSVRRIALTIAVAIGGWIAAFAAVSLLLSRPL